ncbi:MAG: cation diffusion facilitator family transporter [Candidatus Bruticola sp.]
MSIYKCVFMNLSVQRNLLNLENNQVNQSPVSLESENKANYGKASGHQTAEAESFHSHKVGKTHACCLSSPSDKACHSEAASTFLEEGCDHNEIHEHHHHGHHHHHHFETDNLDATIRRVLYFSIFINLFYVVLEAFCGLKFNSLGLLSDAGHNLSDVFSLALALLAAFLVAVRPKQNLTYGLRKSTILISLVNAVILILAVLGIVYESVRRFSHPEPIPGCMVSYVAGAGIIVNGLTVWLLNRNRRDDLNVAGAFWHMAADTLVSVGVLISGIIISFTNWYIVDTIVSLIVAAVIVVASWDFLCDSVRLALDGVPSHINIKEVSEKCLQVEGVRSVHHLHIWALSTRLNAMTAHIVVEEHCDGSRVKKELRQVLGRLGIDHATLELENGGEECSAAENCCGS